MYYNINSFQLRWFVTIILLLSLCTSNGWGTTTYTKVTSGAQLSTNDVVIIASESASAPDDGVTGWDSSKDATTSTTEANWRRFTVTLVGDTAFTLHYTSSGTSYYIYGKDPDFTFNSAGLKSLFMKSYLPNLAFGKSKKVSNVTAWRYLHLQHQSTYYRFYLSNNNYTQYYVWKVTESSCSNPDAPTKGSITSRGATLSTTSSSADYQFFCSTSSSPASKTADYTVSSGQSVTISDLKYGTTYYYWARHDCGSSSYSNWVAGSPTSFTTSCPNSLSVSAGNLTTSGATFTITDSNSPTYISFNGSGYGYEIYYSTSSDTPESSPSGTVTTTSTSKSVTGLSAGQMYYYWVRGYGPNGKSSWVSGGNFTTLDLSSIAITTDPTKLAYIHGETFDKTGAVVTATYTNYATANVSSSAVWTPSTALTTTGSNTITATYTENGTEKTTTIDVTVYGVTMQARDESGNTIPAAGPSSPTRTVTSITPQNDKSNYVWKEWSVSGASLGSSKETKSNSINTPTADITVTAVYWAPRNVVWMVNGAAYTTGSPTSTIAYNKEWKDLKLPTDPTPPCGDKFMGWTTTNIGSTGLDKTDDAAAITALDLMTSDNKSEKTGATGHYITDATVTFYAVFADYVEPAD